MIRSFEKPLSMQTEKAPLTLPAIDGPLSASVTAWFEILHLKQVFRKGWLERGLPPADARAWPSTPLATPCCVYSLLNRPPT